MIEVYNKTIEYSFYLLFALVPLVLTPFNFELFEFNKMILTYFLTVIIVGAWLIKMVATKKIIFSRTFLDVGVLLFFISQLVSTIYSIDRHTSLFGYYSRFNGGLLSIISYILLYYAFVSNMNVKKSLCTIRFALCTASLVAAYGILEHFGIDEKYWVQDVKNRVFSTLGQPNWLAAYLVGLAPLTMALALPNAKLKIKNSIFSFRINPALLAFLFSIFYICLLYTKSRSGLLGFVVAYLTFWLLSFMKKRRRILKSFVIFNLIFVITSLLIGTPFTPSIGQIFRKPPSQPISAEFAEASPAMGGTPSGEIRKIVWRGAMEIFRHHPILGTGPETFAYSYYWYRPREHNDTSEWDFLYNKAHNEYLNYLASTGIFGLGSYLLLIGAFVYWSLKKFKISNDISHLALLSGYAGLAVSNFFGFSVAITNLFFFLFPAMAIVLASKPQGVLPSPPLRWDFRKYSSILFILLATCYLLLATCKLWYADVLFAKGKKYIKANAPDRAVESFQKAVKFNSTEPLFHNELSNAASVLVLSLYSENQATAAAQLAQFAIQESDKALKISPYHLNYWKTRTKMFYNLAQVDKKYYQNALQALIKATELAPTEAKVFYNLGILYYHLGQKNEAIKIMEKTVELKPNYEAAKQKLEGWYNE